MANCSNPNQAKSQLKFVLRKKVSDGPHETPVFIDSGIPFLSVDGIQNSELVFDGCRYISLDDFERFSKKMIVEKNDVLVAKAASVGKIARVKVDFNFGVWSPLAVLKPNLKKIRPEFLEFYLQSNFASDQIEILSTSNTQKNISMDDIERLQILYPHLKEQTRIAKYLDKKTAQIDSLIEKIQRKIVLLKEQRTAIISQSVTKGLNPKVKMKDSGVEWIGEIPKHWDLVRLRYLCDITTGGRNTEDNVEDGEFPFFVRSPNVEKIDSWSFDGEAVLTSGDGAGVGKIFHYYNGKFDFHQRVYNFSSFERVSGKYFYWFIRVNFHYELLKWNAKSTVDSVRLPLLQNFPIVLPNDDEQFEILKFIEGHASLVERQLNMLLRKITLLKEYRQSLISNVVTGKVKITDNML